jgi:hypothetical protein
LIAFVACNAGLAFKIGPFHQLFQIQQPH